MARIAKVHRLNPLDPPSIVSIHTPPGNKPFPIISDQANNIIRTFVKGLRKTGIIAGVVHRKPISNVPEMWKLFDLIELGSAESKNPTQLQKTLSFLADEDETIKDSQRRQFCPCE